MFNSFTLFMRCTGDSTQCPLDAVKNASALCRATQGICDIQEYSNFHLCKWRNNTLTFPIFCDGVSISCPADVLMNDSQVCRTPNGPCDSVEYLSVIYYSAYFF